MSAFDNTVKIASANLDDKEYLSKIINDYVKDAASNSSALRNSASGKNFFNRDDVLKALSNIQLTYKTRTQ